MVSSMTAEPGLFASEVTQARIHPDTIAAMQAAHPAGRHTMVFGPDDFTDSGTASPSLANHFNSIGFDHASKIGERAIEDMSVVAGTGMAFPASTVRPSMEAFAENACMITIPIEGTSITLDGQSYYDFSQPQDYAAAILQIDPAWLESERIPGRNNDMQTWTAHHESDHCGNADTPYYEYRSDEFANNRYAADYAAGRVNDPEVPYFMRSQRAGAEILGVGGEAYAQAALSPLAGEESLSDQQLSIATGEISEARDRIYGSIQDRTGMDMNEIPAEPDQQIARGRMIYGEAKLMDQQGSFDDLPYGQRVVENFVDGAERYGHNLYDVRPENQIHTAPQLSAPAAAAFPTFRVTQDMAL